MSTKQRVARPGARGAPLPPVGTSLIEVKQVGKSYGSVLALRDVTTSVNAGEVTCVLGDNGAGKSTFIKILAGAHTHSEGALVVDGEGRRFTSPEKPWHWGSPRSTKTSRSCLSCRS